MEDSGGLQFIGSQRVTHDRVTKHSATNNKAYLFVSKMRVICTAPVAGFELKLANDFS